MSKPFHSLGAISCVKYIQKNVCRRFRSETVGHKGKTRYKNVTEQKVFFLTKNSKWLPDQTSFEEKLHQGNAELTTDVTRPKEYFVISSQTIFTLNNHPSYFTSSFHSQWQSSIVFAGVLCPSPECMKKKQAPPFEGFTAT